MRMERFMFKDTYYPTKRIKLVYLYGRYKNDKGTDFPLQNSKQRIVRGEIVYHSSI